MFLIVFIVVIHARPEDVYIPSKKALELENSYTSIKFPYFNGVDKIDKSTYFAMKDVCEGGGSSIFNAIVPVCLPKFGLAIKSSPMNGKT